MTDNLRAAVATGERMSADAESSRALDGDTPGAKSSGLARLLREKQEQIVSSFVAEVKRNALSSPGATPVLIVDDVPSFLEQIAEALTRLTAGGATPDGDTRDAARRHGVQRWEIGYDL